MPCEIPLTRGYVAIIDDEDVVLALDRWHASFSGDQVYGKRKRQGRVSYLHREVLERKLGRTIAAGMVTDHINGNGLDNRRENLQEVTHQANIQKMQKRGRHRGRPRQSNTHCRHGHEMSGYNILPGNRCRECGRIRQRAYSARRRGKITAGLQAAVLYPTPKTTLSCSVNV